MKTNIFEKVNCFDRNSEIKSILKWGERREENIEVSIILPVYNHPEYFKRALVSAINQDYNGNYEIIVIDNNMDDTMDQNEFERFVEQVASSKVLYYKNEHNIGGCNSWNRGVLYSNAPYFTFLHDDDEFYPYTLSRLMNLKKRVGKSAIFSGKVCIDGMSNMIDTKIHNPAQGRFFVFFRRKSFYKLPFFRHFMQSVSCGGGSLFHKSCFLELGGYNDDYAPSPDYALHIAYAYYWGSYFNSIPTLKYRIADNDSFKVYEKCLEADMFFRSCMKEKIKLPYKFLDRIIKANYQYSLSTSSRFWSYGKIKRTLSFIDYFIIRFLYFLLRINTLKL